MPKLPVLKPKELIKRFDKLGFVKDHQTGSHYLVDDKKRAVVPYHIKELPKGTLMAILRESGISREEILGK